MKKPSSKQQDGSCSPRILAAPPAALVDLLNEQRLKPGTVLAVGCGLGYDAMHFAGKGFTASGVDFSKNAIDKAKQISRKRGIECSFYCESAFDLEKGHSEKYDYIFERAFFQQIEPAEREKYAKVAHSILKDDGTYIGIFRNNPDDTHKPIPTLQYFAWFT